MISNNKANTHIEFNTYHNSFFDSFFYYITFLGDGITATLVAIILLTIKYRSALLVGISNIIASVITQLLKHTVFADVVRPKKFFEGVHDLYLVPGVENYLYNSFPSGHATCAFSLYLALALIVENNKLKFLFFVIAFFVGLSRVYLSQHFFEDVYVGSIIGVSITFLCFYFLQKQNKKWLESSLINTFKN